MIVKLKGLNARDLYQAVRRMLVENNKYERSFRDFRDSDIPTIITQGETYGIVFMDELDCAKADKILVVEAAFNDACANGVSITEGYLMKCTFEDAAIVRQAAEFMQRQSITTMSLKDVTGLVHEGVAIADALTAADEMAAGYMALWNDRETKKAAVRAASTVQEVLQLPA